MFEVGISCDAATATEKKTQVGKKPSNKNYYNRRVAEIFIVIDGILQQHQRRNVFDLLSLCANRGGPKTNGRRKKNHYRLTF